MASEGAERRLAAILSADAVGYTRLMSEDEAGTIRTLSAYREAIQSLVEQHHGRVVDSPGDNILAEFPNALDAVQCTVEVQSVLRVRNQSLPEQRRMLFRIGVHLGDVAVDGERIYGDGVNIAARLEGLADPGGICISGMVHSQVESKLGLSYEDLGEQSIKNIGKPVRVFRVGMEAESAPTPGPSSSMLRVAMTLAAVVVVAVIVAAGWRILSDGPTQPVAADISAPIRSIAVLPLENLSGDPEQEYFADGMTEALIGDLAKIGALSVISRTSVMRYKQSDKSLPQIAQELGVDGVIEGTVMRAGGHVRITAQLIDARNDVHLWSNRYDRELSDVLALQSDVARAVAEQVRLELTPQERAALAASRSVDPRAYDAYLRGLHSRGPTTLVAGWGPTAIAHFERAVELEPTFAEGYTALAKARFLLGIAGYDERYRGELKKARDAAQRALEADERMALAHAVLAEIRYTYEWDFSGARRAFERALKLGPGDPDTLNAYAFYLLWAEGKIQEALALSERILRVAPFDLYYRADRVRLFYNARDYERALAEVQLVRGFAPDFADIDIATTYFMLGRLEDEYRERIAYLKRCGAPCDWEVEARERGWAEGGWEGAVRTWLEAATEREGYSPFMIASIYSMIGETDEVFAWLDRGYRSRDPTMIIMNAIPLFDPLRSDPRFQDLLRRIGFPED
jgi:TolB-like protein/class 3 adenylate cyclase